MNVRRMKSVSVSVPISQLSFSFSEKHSASGTLVCTVPAKMFTYRFFVLTA